MKIETTTKGCSICKNYLTTFNTTIPVSFCYVSNIEIVDCKYQLMLEDWLYEGFDTIKNCDRFELKK